MEWDAIKLIWNAALTIGGGLVAYFYSDIMKKLQKSDERTEKLQNELNDVKLKYVEKSEIERIEKRIDTRFLEMREFITQIMHRD